MQQAQAAHPPPASSPAHQPADQRATDFEAFVAQTEPKLRRALIAAYGFDDGRDATAEALAYAWEHWDRLTGITNLPGYLFRVGQTRGRHRRRPVVFAVQAPDCAEVLFEPALPAALAALSERQRLAVVLAHGYGYTHREVAELTGMGRTTVQNHVERGLAKLRKLMGVTHADQL
jgi:DNA-directed RNA polymerase specialized sigma24 family protein